jgi:hypothetical protein
VRPSRIPGRASERAVAALGIVKHDIESASWLNMARLASRALRTHSTSTLIRAIGTGR